MAPTEGGGELKKIGDTIFSIIHLLALIAVFLYGVVALVRTNYARFALVMGGLALYYAIVLHKPVRKEIARRRAGRART
jgi:hypothetical protein